MPEIQFKNLSKTFDNGFHALDNLSLSVQKGEFITIIGPSGCGKTTLLRTLAGLESPSSGEILINGKSINHLEPKDRNLGMVFQNYALFPHLTVSQNISFGLDVRSIDINLKKQRVQELLQLVQLEKFADRYPHQLSGGQRQRIGVARALYQKPKILILDDSLSAVDTQTEEKIINNYSDYIKYIIIISNPNIKLSFFML